MSTMLGTAAIAPTASNQNPVTTPDTTCNGRNSPGGTSGEIKI